MPALAYPLPIPGARCYLIPIDAAYVPIAAGSMRELGIEASWQSWPDYELGYNALAEIYIAMANNCIDELIEASNRLYRLWDTQLNGTEYTAQDIDGEIVVTPAIPAAPPLPLRTIHTRLEVIEQVLDNAYNGVSYAPRFENTTGLRFVVDQILLALETEESMDADLLAKLELIRLLLA